MTKVIGSFTPRALGIILLLLSIAIRADDNVAQPAGLFTYSRGGPERTGAFPETNPPDRPATLWVDELGGHVGTPIAAGDRLILGNRNGKMLALSAKDGEPAWSLFTFGLCSSFPSSHAMGQAVRLTERGRRPNLDDIAWNAFRVSPRIPSFFWPCRIVPGFS